MITGCSLAIPCCSLEGIFNYAKNKNKKKYYSLKGLILRDVT